MARVSYVFLFELMCSVLLIQGSLCAHITSPVGADPGSSSLSHEDVDAGIGHVTTVRNVAVEDDGGDHDDDDDDGSYIKDGGTMVIRIGMHAADVDFAKTTGPNDVNGINKGVDDGDVVDDDDDSVRVVDDTIESNEEGRAGIHDSFRHHENDKIFENFHDEFYGIIQHGKKIEEKGSRHDVVSPADEEKATPNYDYSFYDTFYGIDEDNDDVKEEKGTRKVGETNGSEENKHMIRKEDALISGLWRETVDKMIDELTDFLDKNTQCNILLKKSSANVDSGRVNNSSIGANVLNLRDQSGGVVVVGNDGKEGPECGSGISAKDYLDLRVKALSEMDQRIGDVFRFCEKSCNNGADNDEVADGKGNDRNSKNENNDYGNGQSADNSPVSSSTTTTTATIQHDMGSTSNNNNDNTNKNHQQQQQPQHHESHSPTHYNDKCKDFSSSSSSSSSSLSTNQYHSPTESSDNKEDVNDDHDDNIHHSDDATHHHQQQQHNHHHHHHQQQQQQHHEQRHHHYHMSSCYDQKVSPCVDVMSDESVMSQMCTKMTSLEKGSRCMTSQLLAIQKRADETISQLEADVFNLKRTVEFLQRSAMFYAEAPFGSSQVRGYKVKVTQGQGFEPTAGYFIAPYDGAYQITVGYFRRVMSNTDDLINVILDHNVIFRLHVDGSDEQRVFMTSLRTGQSLSLKTNVDYNNNTGDDVNSDLVHFGAVLVK